MYAYSTNGVEYEKRKKNTHRVISLREFSEEDLEYFPIGYLEKYVSSIELQEIWNKLPEKHKKSPILKLNLPCFKHFNNTEGATQFDGPPPPIKLCSASMAVMIEGVIAVCAIVNQVSFCTVPSKFLYENNGRNLSLSKVVHKLKVLFINGTVAELPTDWLKIDIPSVSSDSYVFCIAVFIVKVFIAFAQSLFPILRGYVKKN
ncbi:hypothetical protein ABEB36_015619 [Hypothenemus hampei]|uniref:Uncharacterized protein n=1 Tax=Hypothenemus hampei TaxID=57062 RepID=A0ABD1E157_HYPHA